MARLVARPDRPVAAAYLAALAAVFITAVYPAFTRLSISTTLTPADLLLFRFGVSGLLFAPFLAATAHKIQRADWLAALPLSFLQGWGMAACVIFGLQFAPASHAVALGPGTIAAWIAGINFVVFGVRTCPRQLAGVSIIVIGVGLLLAANGHGMWPSKTMIGDAMFLLASCLGASYLIWIQRSGLAPILAAALVCVTSALIILPWYLAFGASSLASAPMREIMWQLVLQGFLVGCCTLFALNYATLSLGGQVVGTLSALVPVVGAICSRLITGDRVSRIEWAAIFAVSLGVIVASRWRQSGRIDARSRAALVTRESGAGWWPLVAIVVFARRALHIPADVGNQVRLPNKPWRQT